MAAFVLLGLRKAGTPLAIASTPVSAAAPDENERARMATMAHPANSALPSGATTMRSPVSLTSSSPNTRIRNSPIPIMSNMEPMKT